MKRFDAIADQYDETRGGEPRGDEQATFLVERLPPDDSLVLDVGTGTGVVALGLQVRGRRVVGVDVAEQMLRRAQSRIGPAVAVGDACCLPIRTLSVGHAVGVWVAHSVPDPAVMFREMARVLVAGGTFLVVPAHLTPPTDVVGVIFGRMTERIGSTTDGKPTTEDIVQLATPAGFDGRVEELGIREWESSREQELDAIRRRSWRFLSTLDENTFERVTGPAVHELEALPPGPVKRQAVAKIAILTKR